MEAARIRSADHAAGAELQATVRAAAAAYCAEPAAAEAATGASYSCCTR